MPKNQGKNNQKLRWRRYSRNIIEEAFEQYLQQADASYFRSFDYPKKFFLYILDKKQDRENHHKFKRLKKDLNNLK